MGFLELTRNLPSLCFWAARTLFEIYLNFTKFWKPLGAEPWLQGKFAIRALWLELVPVSKAQLLVCFTSLPTCRHPGVPKSHQPCWEGLILSPSRWKYPRVTLPRPLLQLEAGKGFPTPGIKCWLSDVMGTWGKAKQFYRGSVATKSSVSDLSWAPGVMSHQSAGELSFPKGEPQGQQCKASGRCSTKRGSSPLRGWSWPHCAPHCCIISWGLLASDFHFVSPPE